MKHFRGFLLTFLHVVQVLCSPIVPVFHIKFHVTLVLFHSIVVLVHSIVPAFANSIVSVVGSILIIAFHSILVQFIIFIRLISFIVTIIANLVILVVCWQIIGIDDIKGIMNNTITEVTEIDELYPRMHVLALQADAAQVQFILALLP
jgi:FtsH-binding integral membrane protein